MQLPSTMLCRLDDAMRAHQIGAEEDTEQLYRPDAQPAHYLLYLTRLYGFVAPLECALEMTPGLDRMIDLRDRAKAKHIVTDLLALGLRPAALAEMPMCLTVPQFRGVAEAVGWLYVIERQTLMHGILRRHLMATLPRNTAAATTFLGSYEGTTGERWRQLGVLLDTIAAPSYAIADRIESSAAEGYRCMRRWSAREPESATVARWPPTATTVTATSKLLAPD